MHKNNFASNLLKEPTYGYYNSDGSIKVPSFRELVAHVIASANLFGSQKQKVVFMVMAFYVMTIALFVVYVTSYITIGSFLYYLFVALFGGHVYNTIWFHRYCSHHAFSFKNRGGSWFFRYSDILFFSDDSYVIPHLTHHAMTETAVDPYGPHMGWAASSLGSMTNTSVNPNITEKHYQILLKRLSHMHLRFNDYETFKQTGSVENFRSMLIRKITGQVFWVTISYLLGGMAFVFAYFSASFIVITMLLDFNWRGHGGNFREKKKPGWEFGKDTRALNQHFYALVASEWHDNHHNFPSSANCGFLKGQIDFSFLLIKLMKSVGIVSHYNDDKELFRSQYL